MTWTYSGDPRANAKDKLRFLVGDTDPADPQLTDEECLFLLDEYRGNAGLAAIDAVQSMLAGLVTAVDESVGNVSVQNSQRIANLTAILGLLRSKFSMSGGYRIYAGGISRAQKAAVEGNGDRVTPFFFRDDPPGSALDPPLDPATGVPYRNLQ